MPIDFTQLLRGAGSQNPADGWQAGVQEARQEQAYQQQQALQQQALARANETRSQIGDALRTGNYAGAAAAAYGGGYDKLGDGFQSLIKTRQESDAYGRQRLGEMAAQAMTLPTLEQRVQFVQQNAPQLQALGVDPRYLTADHLSDQYLGQLAQYGYSWKDRASDQNTAFSNDTARMTENRQRENMQFGQQNMKVGPGETVYDGQTGMVKYTAPQIVNVGEGAKAVEVGGASGSVQPIRPPQAALAMSQAFAQAGLSQPVIAGILGNAQHESGFDPTKVGDGGTSFGYFQHHADRARMFRRVIGVDPQSATPQQAAQFVVWELHNPQAAGMTPDQANAILNAKTPQEAAMAFQQYFERPAQIDPSRAVSAQQYYQGLYGTPANGGQRDVKVVAEGNPKQSQYGALRSMKQVQSVQAKILSLKVILNQLDRVEQNNSQAEQHGWTGPIEGHVPGNWDSESDVFDKSNAVLGQQIRSMTRTPGEGSMSDYESRLAVAQLPSRTDTHAGRMEAIANLRALAQQTLAGYQDMLQNSPYAGQAGGAPVAPPAGAIQALRSNPSLARQFDQKYGAGSAARVLGR